MTITANLKYCPTCRLYKEVSSFTRRRESKDGLCYQCKKCNCQYVKSRYINNPTERQARNNRTYAIESTEEGKNKKRANKLVKRYSMTVEQYNHLLKEQNYKCAICGSSTPNRKSIRHFIVDHNHITGEIRGLLCSFCNSGLGYLQADLGKQFLVNAIDYYENNMKRSI